MHSLGQPNTSLVCLWYKPALTSLRSISSSTLASVVLQALVKQLSNTDLANP
ncbi:hypothetical protein PtB15_9B630 [Puccinia triticina]|nr:hypothetical protein PtB15_9B630 [Puccinia triticina]